ncbi:MAG: GNAT family N-acetyltransferase [Myxococcales bacterium]|nr:GNAT family N-acetyltransferase [Myxococcales bacterium]
MLTIRLAKACDIPALARVHVAAVRALCRKHYRTQELSRWVDQGPGLYAGLVRSATVMVAELDGVVVGFAAASLAKGYVRAVYVAPGHAGAGIGGRLLARIERAARVLGVRRLRLEATLNAEAFYTRAGYRSLGRGRTALGLGCIRMVKPLPVAKSLHGVSGSRPLSGLAGQRSPYGGAGLKSPVRRPSRGAVDMGRRPRLT